MPKVKTPGPISAFIQNKGVKALLKELAELDEKILPVFLVNPMDYPGSVHLGGEIKDNYTVVGATDAATLTVPVGKRWFLFGGLASRSQNATVLVDIYNENDKFLLRLLTEAAAADIAIYPEAIAPQAAPQWLGLPMKAGWYVKFSFGAAQDANAFVTAIVLEVDA